MIIREAIRDDLERINEIYNQAIPSKMSTADTRPYGMDEREKWFNEHEPGRYPVYVSDSEGVVTGWVSLSAYRPRRDALGGVAEISYYIDREWQRKGVGSALMNYSIEAAPGLGLRSLIAILMGHNHGSIALLRKFGFEEWGRMPGIAEFDGKRYDHLYYGLILK